MGPDTYNLGFCDRYGYPGTVKQHLTEMLDQIARVLGMDAVRSVILFGSTSRGELSYVVRDDGQIDLLSDYEFVIVTRRRPAGGQYSALKEAFDSNKARWGIRSPLFHIEFLLNSTVRFATKTPLVRRIGTYELFEEGVTLFGDNLLGHPLGGRITAENLDYGNTNGLILERLWWLLFYMPRSATSHQMAFAEEEIINYLTARSALEILAIFLPHEGVLVSGYTRRVEWLTRHYPEGAYFDDSFHEYVSNCLDHKLNLGAHDSFVNNYRHLLEGYLSLLSYLLSDKKPHPTPIEALPLVCDQLVRTEKNLFPDPFHRTLQRLMKDYKVARFLGVSSPLSWMWAEKRPCAVAFLLYAHGALLEYLEKRSMPAEYLQEAAGLLTWLTGDSRDGERACCQAERTGDDRVDEWMHLCRRFVHFVVAWRVAPRPHAGNMQEVLQRGHWWK